MGTVNRLVICRHSRKLTNVSGTVIFTSKSISSSAVPMVSVRSDLVMMPVSVLCICANQSVLVCLPTCGWRSVSTLGNDAGARALHLCKLKYACVCLFCSFVVGEVVNTWQ